MKRIKNGFSLIELLIYISISTVLLLSLASFIIAVNQAQKRGIIINEVENQGLRIMSAITQKIRNADIINSPNAAATSSSLSLNMPAPASNPAIFSLNGSVLQLSEGANPASALHNASVSASNVSFYNLSRTGTPGAVKIQFKLRYNYPAGNTNANNRYEKIFYGSASLR